MIVTIIQWNILFKEKPENIVKFLKQSNADIICAQEVIRDSRKGLDVAKYISENLGFEYFYHDADTWDNHQGKEAQGNAIFSRFPIIDTNHVYVQQLKHNPTNALSEGRIYVEIKVNINSKVFTIGTTHLSYSHRFEIISQKKEEIDTLLNIVKKMKKYYIFAGDLNSTPNSYTITQLKKLLSHSGPDYKLKTWTTKPFEYKGFKENDLNWRLDYVFNTKDICVNESKIIECQYSDHLPVQIKIKI